MSPVADRNATLQLAVNESKDVFSDPSSRGQWTRSPESPGRPNLNESPHFCPILLPPDETSIPHPSLKVEETWAPCKVSPWPRPGSSRTGLCPRLRLLVPSSLKSPVPSGCIRCLLCPSPGSTPPPRVTSKMRAGHDGGKLSGVSLPRTAPSTEDACCPRREEGCAPSASFR